MKTATRRAHRETLRPGVDGDADLVRSLRSRDCGAAESLMAAHGGRACRLAARILTNEQDAEEVVQDAFWAVVRKIGRSTVQG